MEVNSFEFVGFVLNDGMLNERDPILATNDLAIDVSTTKVQ